MSSKKKCASMGCSTKCKKKKSNPWIAHVKKTQKKTPSLSYSGALKVASKTYKKKK